MKNNTNNLYITVLIILCTSLIILTNNISSRNSTELIYNKIMDTEYSKIGGKDNYDLLKELQKKEILAYLDTIKKEKPLLIQEVQNKINAKKNNYEFLDTLSINELKKDTYIKGNTGAIVSIIEFSDLECEYCIDYHKSNYLNDILSLYPENTNYIFKNFPLPTHQNSRIIAESTNCIKNLSNGDMYLEYIDKIFNSTNGGGKGLELSQLSKFAEELQINKIDFEKCLNEGTYSQNIEKEFNQGLNLGINSVPSTIILNNKTGEYVLLKEKVEKEQLENIVGNLIN